MAVRKLKLRVSGGSSAPSQRLSGPLPTGCAAGQAWGSGLSHGTRDLSAAAADAVRGAAATPHSDQGLVVAASDVDAPVLPFDPLQRAKQVEALVVQGEARQYYRFRPAPYYGGIATADAHGCDLLCAYCWNYDRNERPSKAHGRFYSPGEVAAELLRIARKKGYHAYRLTGSEPVLGRASLQHVLQVKREVLAQDPMGRFILETNGLVLGSDPALCAALAASAMQLSVRICVKGTDPESFQKVTGANDTGFFLQLTALQELQRRGVAAHAAFMADLFPAVDIESLSACLEQDWGIAGGLELEGLERYPPVMRHLRQRHIDVG
eukprot:EG_transcript_19379